MPGSVLQGAAAVLASLLILWLFRWYCSSSITAKGRLPPGSRGLPVLGETLQFFAGSPSLELHPFFKRRLERYGPIFRTNLIGVDLIVSLDAELNNLVFQQDERLFENWWPESVMRIFGPENLRLVLLQDVQRTAQASLLSWLDLPSVELKEATSSMIFSVTAKRLISYDSSSSDGKLWKQFDAFIRGLLAFPLYIPGTAFYQCMQGRKEVMKILRKLFDERKKAPSRLEKVDFIDLLIDTIKEDKLAMSDNFALNLIFLLLFAGFETTSSGITAAIKFLTDNPKALQELTDEHENIRKRRASPDAEITWEEYKSMKFTSCVIHESLRMANIAPLLFKKAREDVHIKAYTIPKGSKVMVCPSIVHLNPTIYEDPNVFNPWRWKEIAEPLGGASKDFMAFGGGLRLCVGAEFAKLQMAIFLHSLVTKYRWKAIKGGIMVLSPGLRFPDGFHIQLIHKS
ncbi:cytochrome P450 87A3-like [Triticum urartu]|nr:cytochrome P450 87A3-like [Triticum urartu]